MSGKENELESAEFERGKAQTSGPWDAVERSKQLALIEELVNQAGWSLDDFEKALGRTAFTRRAQFTSRADARTAADAISERMHEAEELAKDLGESVQVFMGFNFLIYGVGGTELVSYVSEGKTDRSVFKTVKLLREQIAYIQSSCRRQQRELDCDLSAAIHLTAMRELTATDLPPVAALPDS